MIRSTLLRHSYLSQPHPGLCGGLEAAMQQSSGTNPVATLLWAVLGSLGAEILRSDRRVEIYISDVKFNLTRTNSGWRGRRTPT